MVEGVALLVDEVLPFAPMRQWVLSVPYPLRFLDTERRLVGIITESDFVRALYRSVVPSVP